MVKFQFELREDMGYLLFVMRRRVHGRIVIFVSMCKGEKSKQQKRHTDEVVKQNHHCCPFFFFALL